MTRKRDAGRKAIMGAPAAAANDAGQDGKFSMQAEGLMMKRADDRQPWRICGRFDVLSETRDDEAQAWGLWLRFLDRDGATQQIIVTRDLFAGEGAELRNLLAKRGLYVNPSRGAGAGLCEYLAKLASPKRARVVSRTGWHRIDGAPVFVLPDEIFGQPAVELVYQPSLREPSLFNSGGSLDEWREAVAARCVGNTRLLLAMCVALAAPLLELLAEEGGGLHLRGTARIGKTTALRVAASVWGGETGSGAGAYVRQWRITANAVEGIAAAHSDTLLALDELSQAEARDVGATAYMLANGAGKSRMDRSASLRAPLRFRTLFLSTGEVSLAARIAEMPGSGIRAGQEVRMIDLAADAGAGFGLFEQLHDAATPAAFVESLRAATARCYGTAARAFLHYLVGRLDREPEFPADLRGRQDVLVRDWLETHTDAGGQVRSVARRFALAAVAGELASMAGVTGWEGNDATDAAAACFRGWLADRGTVGAREDAQAVAQLRAFISAHGPSRFEEWRDPPPAVDATQGDPDATPPIERFRAVNRAGWRRWLRDGAERPAWVYYVLPDAMHQALAGLDFKAALQVLIDRGFLIPGRGGKRAQTPRPPGHPQARAYVVLGSLLGAEEAGD